MITSALQARKTEPLPLLKIREVAQILAVSRQTVRALIESGDLDARAVNPSGAKKERKHVRIIRKSLAKFYEKRFGHKLDLTPSNQP